MRFDLYASERLKISRNKASELIREGKILLNGAAQTKPSAEISQSAELNLIDEIYVGRGALKLKSFLAGRNFNLKGKRALDIGSSTGGFTQILLSNGVKSVVCVDVGSDQLAECLRGDRRVEIYENTDIRNFKNLMKFELITCDVAFISVLEILNAINENADENALIIMLFKPQFEVGLHAKRNKKGVVTDLKAVKAATTKFELAAASLGWILQECVECEIKGKEGNAEFFYAFNKGRHHGDCDRTF